jgi:hypothetical protein
MRERESEDNRRRVAVEGGLSVAVTGRDMGASSHLARAAREERRQTQ